MCDLGQHLLELLPISDLAVWGDAFLPAWQKQRTIKAWRPKQIGSSCEARATLEAANGPDGCLMLG